MNALGAGARVGWSRARHPSLPLALAAGSALALTLVRVLQADSTGLSALDDALEGPILGWLLPIFGYLVAQRVTDNQRLEASVQVLARHGVDRRLAALGLLLVSSALTALAGALFAACAVSVAHAHFDASWLRDLALSTLIGAVGGAVYASFFWAASSFGRQGGGRRIAFALDLVFGAGSSLLALPFPRSQLRNLLGGVPAAELSQRGAWLALLVLGALSVQYTQRRILR